MKTGGSAQDVAKLPGLEEQCVFAVQPLSANDAPHGGGIGKCCRKSARLRAEEDPIDEALAAP